MTSPLFYPLDPYQLATTYCLLFAFFGLIYWLYSQSHSPFPQTPYSKTRYSFTLTYLKLRDYPLPYPFDNVSSLLSFAIYISMNIIFVYTPIDNEIYFTRFGYMALANITFLPFFSARNSIVSLFLGISIEKALQYHKWISYLALILATTHGSLFVNEWVQWKFMQEQLSQRPFVVYGLCAWCSLVSLIITSLPFIRRYAYEVFHRAHLIFIILFYVFVNLHTPEAFNFTIAGIVSILVDRSLRLILTWGEILVKDVEEMKGGLTKMTFQKVKGFNYQPGQVLFLFLFLFFLFFSKEILYFE